MRLFASQAASSSADAAERPTGPDELPALTALALRVGGMAASTMRVHDALAEVCRALPEAVDAAGAVVVLTGSADVSGLRSARRVVGRGAATRRRGSPGHMRSVRGGRWSPPI